MTSPKRRLHPASSDDRRTFLGALEFAARCHAKFAQIVRAVVGQRMVLEPCPQVPHSIERGCIRRQERDLDMSFLTVHVLAHQAAAVRFEEFDDFFFIDTALVQPQQAIGARQARNDRDVMAVEVKLDDRSVVSQRFHIRAS